MQMDRSDCPSFLLGDPTNGDRERKTVDISIDRPGGSSFPRLRIVPRKKGFLSLTLSSCSLWDPLFPRDRGRRVLEREGERERFLGTIRIPKGSRFGCISHHHEARQLSRKRHDRTILLRTRQRYTKRLGTQPRFLSILSLSLIVPFFRIPFFFSRICLSVTHTQLGCKKGRVGVPPLSPSLSSFPPGGRENTTWFGGRTVRIPIRTNVE